MSAKNHHNKHKREDEKRRKHVSGYLPPQLSVYWEELKVLLGVTTDDELLERLIVDAFRNANGGSDELHA